MKVALGSAQTDVQQIAREDVNLIESLYVNFYPDEAPYTSAKIPTLHIDCGKIHLQLTSEEWTILQAKVVDALLGITPPR